MPVYVIHAGLYQIRVNPKTTIKGIISIVRKLEASGHFQEVNVYKLEKGFKFKLKSLKELEQ